MASRSLDDLTPETRDKAETVLELCRAGGVELLIYCTLRSLEEQARLWRQSRSLADIQATMAKLSASGYGFLADIMDKVGPCTGPKVTNAYPGASFHNYKEAFDAVPLIGGKPAWEYNQAPTQWDLYGKSVKKAGLYWAGDWVTFRELPHAQLRQGGNPLKDYPPDHVQALLQENGVL